MIDWYEDPLGTPNIRKGSVVAPAPPSGFLGGEEEEESLLVENNSAAGVGTILLREHCGAFILLFLLEPDNKALLMIYKKNFKYAFSWQQQQQQQDSTKLRS